MNQKILIILFTVFTGILLGIYIIGNESNDSELSDANSKLDIKPTIQIANRGKPKVSLKRGYEQIGHLQAKVPQGWKRENPSSSMRVAQFILPGKNGVGELVVFSGIGGTIDANLERWYNQFKSESSRPTSEFAVRSQEQVNGMDITFSYVEGTYIKSSMGMDGSKTEMPNYALLAAIISSPGGLYFFKGTGPRLTIMSQKDVFYQFIRSIDKL
tara:strand:- start:2592 stop:3233 length:642 start_codon:yes stop_codon:yes gene_type:complete